MVMVTALSTDRTDIAPLVINQTTGHIRSICVCKFSRYQSQTVQSPPSLSEAYGFTERALASRSTSAHHDIEIKESGFTGVFWPPAVGRTCGIVMGGLP